MGDKMKKISVLLLILSFMVIPLSAALQEGTGSWTNKEEITNNDTNQRATLLATFAMTGETIPDSVKIGFTDSIEGFSLDKEIETIKKSVTISDKNKDGIASNGIADSNDTVNVFYQITSTKELEVYLSIDAPLSAGGEPATYLGWSVTWDEGMSISRKETDLSGPDSELIGEHNPSTDKVGSAGIKALTIATENYENKKMGTYEGYITVSVKSV